jgi:hypothetical protein
LPSYRRRRRRPNEEKNRTISEKNSKETSEETGPAEVFDLVDEESYADAWSVWLDHAH